MASTTTSNGKNYPFVISFGGMLGREALFVIANYSQLMAAKMDEPILHVHVWINGRIAIAVTRSYSKMIGGDQLPSPLRDQEMEWDLELGLRLYQ